MSTTLLDRIQATGEAVTLPNGLGCGVLTWHVKAGEQVERRQALATLDEDGLETAITATTAGKVSALMLRTGEEAQPGQPLCYISPNGPVKPSEPPHGAQRAKRAQSRVAPEKPIEDATEAHRGLQVPSNANGRRGQHIQELAIGEPPLPEPVPLKRARKPKIVTRTTRPTDNQAERFNELLGELEANGYDFRRSEIERVMYDLLLSLPVGDIVSRTQAQREKEQAGGYGIGYV